MRQAGRRLALTRVSEGLRADLDRQHLTDAIGIDRIFGSRQRLPRGLSGPATWKGRLAATGRRIIHELRVREANRWGHGGFGWHAFTA